VVPPNVDPEAQLEQALRRQDWTQAMQVADRLIARSRGSVPGWLARARCNLSLGRLRDAEADLERLARLAPHDPGALLLQGIVHHRLGRSERAVSVLRPLLDRKPPNRVDVAVALAETLHRAARHDEMASLMEREDVCGADPRAALFRARVVSKNDPGAAIAALEGIARSEGSDVLRRITGFEAVRLLDKAGRYREAFDLAAFVHQHTTPRFDVDGLVGRVREQRDLLARGAFPARARVQPVQGVAMVVALPRSGTTLLEQMLDSHPDISGIGEYDGVRTLADGVVASGAWPWGLGNMDAARALQDRYLEGARVTQRSGTRWTFDKNLHAWQWLPAVAAVLPGAVCLHVSRDPRDTAISLFLSNFHPVSFGWTRSIEDIRRVAEAERSLLPQALETLEIPHEAIVYEDLVADPVGHARRCLERLGLAMADQVVQPERNQRTVLTLSHEQVRSPINTRSIGRWRHYAWAFEQGWASLAAQHDARRMHR
jgi:tetratricopeptide (TPR) repeat protein